MSWLVDNATPLYILLGLVAAGLVVAWRFNQRVKFLLYAAGVLAIIPIIWLLTLFVPTDRKQLEANVNAMADAVVEGKVDDVFKHVANDFHYKEMKRDEVYRKIEASLKLFKVHDVRITKFKVEEASRENRSAKVSFLVSGSADGADKFFFRTEADFALDGAHWKMKTMRFYNPAVNQDQEIDLPGLR